MRFNYEANCFDEAEEYLRARAKTLLRFGVRLNQICRSDDTYATHGDAIAIFQYNGVYYASVYVLSQNRGLGRFSELLSEARDMVLPDNLGGVLTVPDCEIEEYLDQKGIPYRTLDPRLLGGTRFVEYDIISSFWKDRFTKRTGVHFMNHIDEGLRVIADLGGTERAMRIYALHGFLQQTYKDDTFDSALLNDVSPSVIIGAMEYRSVANAHLSYHPPDTLRLSEDTDVNMALIADKVQNRKDFERYHLGSHKRSNELDAYFKRWLKALGVSESSYESLIIPIS